MPPSRLFSISSRWLTCSRMVWSKTVNTPLPAFLATYIAVSASRIMSSACSYSGPLSATPMLAVEVTDWPAST